MTSIGKSFMRVSGSGIFRLFVLLTGIISLIGCGGGGSSSPATGNITPTYTVTYNGNGNTGGSVPTDRGSYQQGQIVTVMGNTGVLARTGYTFAGWNTTADGTGTTYSQAQTFTIGAANVTLYAQWTVNPTYTVTYNDNGSTGGAVPVDSTNYQQGQVVTVLGNTGNLVRAGYTFGGWNTATNGSGIDYAASGAVTFNMSSADVILYAKWTANPTYTVTYNGNGSTGGTVPTDSTNYQQAQTVTVSGNSGNLVRTGYAFTGWNTLANGSGTAYAQSQTFAMGSANVTLYAVWAPTYTVTYMGNGNTGGNAPTDSGNYQQGQTVTVLANTGSLVRTAYTFAGWNTAANGSGTDYAASGAATFTMGSVNVTLYAKWTANPTYTVTYNGNGNTGGTVPIDGSNYLQGATVTVKTNYGNLVKTGSAFSGWNTAADGSGTDYTDLGAATFTMGAANVTIYAKWTAFTLPTLVTAGTTSITGSKATSGGAISADGGAAVTARGVCWGLTTGPTISDSKTTNGTGTGSFVSSLAGLSLNTTYYVRAYATNSVGTAYGNEITFTTASTYSYGDTGPAGGLIFYDRGPVSGSWQYLEAAPSDQSTNTGSGNGAIWGNQTPSLVTAQTISSGASNSAAIFAQWGVSNSYAVGLCHALNLGGLTDWFLPSKDELNQMWLNLGASGQGNFNSSYYWSSSQTLTTSEAWSQSMVNGGLQMTLKDWGYLNTRCVRQF